MDEQKLRIASEEKDTEQFTDEEIEAEQSMDEEIDDNSLTGYDIAVFYNTYNLSTLLSWWDKKKLIIPPFQRSYVWNIKRASEYVDTILRGLPGPSLFFYEDIEQSKLLVVDGQQRLNSLFNYVVKGTFDDEPFRLTGTIHPKWKNKTYSELEKEDQESLYEALMNVTVIRTMSPDNQATMYLAFQRLNTGGITLKAQEIRMAASYGPLAKYLHEISSDTRFDRWSFLRTKAQREHNDFAPLQEFFLKFFAHYFMYPHFSGSSTRAMLDEFFSMQKDFDKPKYPKPGYTYFSEDDFKAAFSAVLDIMLSLSDDDITPNSKPTPAYLEAIWVGLTYRKLRLGKDINEKSLHSYIHGWKETLNKIKEGYFDELFSPRRASSTKSAYERINASIEYFSGDF